MFVNLLDYAIDFMSPEATALRHRDRLEPDLNGRLAAVDVDMGRFVRLMTVEVEAHGANARDRGH